MPLEIEIDRDAGALIVRGSGRLVDDDFVETAERIRQNPDLRRRNALFDYRDVQDVSGLKTSLIQRFAESDDCREALAGRRVAIVAHSDSLYGLSRLYQGHSESSAVRLYRAIEPAMEYVGLRGPQEPVDEP